jgi:hypothetical protein
MTNLETLQKLVGTKVDNDWGPKTKAAVLVKLNLSHDTSDKQLQKHVGAIVDGDIGQNTIACILAHLKPAKFNKDSIAALVIQIAKGELGAREEGRNTGRKVRQYQAADWLDGTGYAWCASFICYLIQKAGEQIELPFKRPRTALAYGFSDWAKEEGLKVTSKPKSIKAGEIVIFTFSHIGIAIADSSGGYVTTIEGNTNQAGSREGDGVYQKTRALSLIKASISLE